MKQVKYRLWCNNKKEWEKDEWHLTSDGVIIDTRRNIEMKKETHFLNQFTGLFDKQGVEIYEGDLLQDDKNRLFEVISDCRISHTGYSMCCIKNKSKNDHIQIGMFYEFHSWFYPDNFLGAVGNVYENPEMLENEKS